MRRDDKLEYGAIAICVFWIAYACRSTILSESTVIQGLYYPIYLAFVVVVAKNALTSKRQGEAKIWLGLYGVFLFSMLLGVLRNQSLQIDFMTSQLMFIYCLGLLAFFQFRSERGWRAISLTMAFVSMLVSLWVVFTFSTTPGYEVYRGGVIVNANYISTIIMIGGLVIAGLLVKKIGLWRLAMAIPAILLCFYSMTLLASRGMSIAFLIGIAVIYGTNSGRAKTWFYLLCLAVVVLVVLPRLPGSDSLMNRFGGSDVGTLNERMIIWRGLWEALGNGSFLDLLLGSGFRASEDIVASVTGGNLTSTHNGYLRILVDQGVMGLSVFLAMLALIIRRLWRERQRCREALAIIVTLGVANFSGSETDGFLFWIGFGVVASRAFGEIKYRGLPAEVAFSSNWRA